MKGCLVCGSSKLLAIIHLFSANCIPSGCDETPKVTVGESVCLRKQGSTLTRMQWQKRGELFPRTCCLHTKKNQGMGPLTFKDAWDDTEPLNTKDRQEKKMVQLGGGGNTDKNCTVLPRNERHTLAHGCSILKDWSLVVWNLESAEPQRVI